MIWQVRIHSWWSGCMPIWTHLWENAHIKGFFLLWVMSHQLGARVLWGSHGNGKREHVGHQAWGALLWQGICGGQVIPGGDEAMMDLMRQLETRWLEAVPLGMLVVSAWNHTPPWSYKAGPKRPPTDSLFYPLKGGGTVTLHKLRKQQPPSNEHASSLFNCRQLYWVYTYCRVDIPKINAV